MSEILGLGKSRYEPIEEEMKKMKKLDFNFFLGIYIQLQAIA